jgi:hypothetical protein
MLTPGQTFYEGSDDVHVVKGRITKAIAQRDVNVSLTKIGNCRK